MIFKNTYNKKASAFVWFTATILVFAIAIIYIIMTQVVIPIQQATNSTLDDPDYASTYNTVILVWKYWPIMLLVGIIIISVVVGIRREPYTGYERF